VTQRMEVQGGYRTVLRLASTAKTA
jgi:hypothetical protein